MVPSGSTWCMKSVIWSRMAKGRVKPQVTRSPPRQYLIATSRSPAAAHAFALSRAHSVWPRTQISTALQGRDTGRVGCRIKRRDGARIVFVSFKFPPFQLPSRVARWLANVFAIRALETGDVTDISLKSDEIGLY